MSTNQEDPHHCRCFYIHPTYFEEFQNKLKKIGFKKPFFEENHGQIFGLTKRLDKYTQIHIKCMKNGNFEAEMEYPPDYPVAHLNQEHSYSAHYELKEIMDSFQLPYSFRINPPLTCLQRIIKKAVNPTPAGVFAALGITAIVGAAAVYYLTKDDEDTDDEDED